MSVMAHARAGIWAMRAAVATRKRLRTGRIDSVEVPSAPPGYEKSRRVVLAVLNRGRFSCLVRSLVVQAWDAKHGRPRDVVIGVTAPGRGFGAHAWLEGDPVCQEGDFYELHRRPA